ncbi:NAD(P)H-binding protein [Marinobacter sp. CHS3-4]|uniref:NmrA family NAD(P)-binding protein n=1 Tax=Marinobacter sp. CHS3-4 TaxID=3045174 RepID=UPI0024B63480|nr:NAD(P)H-binding protein [Marinobacter sp. CHS3-4]MDI9244235.1 NAD(P)H-binding protein [Marinobacter sp. CHS3-4]
MRIQSMKTELIAVVGSTGKTGARVLAQLNSMGIGARGLSRNSQVPFDWENRVTWPAALEGVRAVYVTYYPDLAVPQAEADIREFVAVAKQQGVEHLVLMSGRGEEGARRAEQVVETSGLAWNVVRASWFMQNFSESFMLDGLQAGELVLPQPNASEPFIDVDDIASVAVAALTNPALRNQLLEVTGPELLTFDQCVQAIANASGREIGFTPVPVDAYLEGAKAEGLPDDIAWLINELFVNVLDGRNEHTTNTVQKVLGRPARSFADYVARVSPEVWGGSDVSDPKNEPPGNR